MWVEIIVARAAYPIVGAVINPPDVICQQLIDGKLAKEVKAPGKKPVTTSKTTKPDDK